ncbi:MAG: phosphomannomutase/phosphoglucomutase, partial [Clostridia bacterium]|nr:phosphomannomutase/phosphoglucomutase [Clostridia bacterium]
MIDWKHFKSGTDIRGVAVDGVAGEPLDMTDEAVSTMARAFARWLANATGKKTSDLRIAVGRDSRISGPRLRDAVCAGLVQSGVTALDCGLASTPAMFMSTLDLPCDGAIQLTASHHPFHRNGLKFFRPTGGLEGGDISAILALCEADDFVDADGGEVIETSYMPRYAARLRTLICEGVNAEQYDKPLAGFRIVVDAGNGAGGFYATEVLAPLGADIEGSQFLEPDGRFPNHIPNPEDAEAMRSVSEATVRAKADIGVIFDTDVDRAGCVDADGREINRNRLVALAAAIALENAPKGSVVVTDSVTSDGLKTFIEETLDGKHCRFKRGYKNVINEAIRLCDEGQYAPLAIETSGHAALKENYFLD